jgi:asparagine synthase (glutamine-hydrolysing)
MCGINGIFSFGPEAAPIDRDELLRTRDAMFARGPDAAGAWVSSDGRVGLAARRLAILDLSSASDQPVGVADGRVQLVLNGEIYNFRELRAQLEMSGCRLRSSGDTEVIAALYLRHGEAALQRLRGMFALALWDERPGFPRRLLLARDPLGVKPLYYSLGPATPAATYSASAIPAADGILACATALKTTAGTTAATGQLRFASQVKALEAGGQISRAVDPAGLAGFLLWGSVPEPWTLRNEVRALPAGCILAATEGQVAGPWRFADIDGLPPTLREASISAPPPLPSATLADPPSLSQLGPEAAIEDSVVAHLVSDVPLAVFLSAGLDSALVAALACRHLADPPVSLTMAFDVLAGTHRDEAAVAAAVARRLGTRHVECRFGREDFVRLWPAAINAMDQPSIDGVNTFTVSRAAHEAGLKVVLSGLGGDELFGSYPSFADVPRTLRAARWARRLPGLAAAWPPLAQRLAPSRPKLRALLRHGTTLAGSYFLRRALFLPDELPGLMGAEAAAAGLAAYDPIADASQQLSPAAAGNGHPPDAWLAVQLMESSLYMRNQLLRDSDWASMACSVELRVPLADAHLHHHLAAAGFQPARRLGKSALVRRLAPELPDAVWQRPKSGFYLPVLEWLRPGELGAAGRNLGSRSRALAALVLSSFGIVLQPAAARPAPGA